MRNRKIYYFAVILSVLMFALSSCGKRVLPKGGDMDSMLNEKQRDSLRFAREHHYSENYNFVVSADSLFLLKQLPEEVVVGMPTDTLQLSKGDHVVVAEIHMVPNDEIDSIWVQVAHDQFTFGWIHESELLPAVVPDDPISQFISIFSDIHYTIFIVVIILIAAAYIVRTILRRNDKIVHFNDIASFYPTLLTLIVATSASFYASIQNFAPDTWRGFYFHPTLNPFVVEPVLAIFLVSVWAMLIVGLASVDVVRHRLPFGEAVLYLCGLAAVCAADYIIFSVTTLWYVGYFLLAAYIVFALWRYYRHSRAFYVCGNCGQPMHSKGRCSACGAINE
ncbi:MAG: zinc ribbon domain-containing protein [Prevotella sp.]|nr:zinc ribbon domain-containing protein [Prevotella sp.]